MPVHCDRRLLRFGKVAPYVGYIALKDFFPSYEMKPNPNCTDAACRARQAEQAVRDSASGGDGERVVHVHGARLSLILEMRLSLQRVKSSR
jgi:hypothetical protein